MPLVDALAKRGRDIGELVAVVHSLKLNLWAVDDWRRSTRSVCRGDQIGEIELAARLRWRDCTECLG